MIGALALGAGLLLGSASPAAAGGGCRGRGSTSASGTEVHMTDDRCFEPTVLHATPGERVTWINAGLSEPHVVAGATIEWGNYEEFRPGQSVSYTFDKPGTYPYYCFTHNGMVGAVVVGDGKAVAAGGSGDLRVSAAPPSGLSASDRAEQAGREDAEARGSGGNAPVAFAAVGLLAGLAGVGVGFGVSRAR